MIPFKLKIHKGRIAVYSNRHKLIDSKLYYTPDGMKRIMAKWLRDFSGVDGFYIQVRPYDEEETKKVYKLPVCHTPKISDEVKGKLIRPAAVYTNIVTNHYGLK